MVFGWNAKLVQARILPANNWGRTLSWEQAKWMSCLITLLFISNNCFNLLTESLCQADEIQHGTFLNWLFAYSESKRTFPHMVEQFLVKREHSCYSQTWYGTYHRILPSNIQQYGIRSITHIFQGMMHSLTCFSLICNTQFTSPSQSGLLVFSNFTRDSIYWNSGGTNEGRYKASREFVPIPIIVQYFTVGMSHNQVALHSSGMMLMDHCLLRVEDGVVCRCFHICTVE